MNDPANAALKNHKREYLQGEGAPEWRWLGSFFFSLTNVLNRWEPSGPQSSRASAIYAVILGQPNGHRSTQPPAKHSLCHTYVPTGDFKFDWQWGAWGLALELRTHTVVKEVQQNLKNCWNITNNVIFMDEVLFGRSCFFSSVSCISNESLVSQCGADIFIGPKITYGAGFWMLSGWTSERVDRRPERPGLLWNIWQYVIVNCAHKGILSVSISRLSDSITKTKTS